MTEELEKVVAQHEVLIKTLFQAQEKTEQNLRQGLDALREDIRGVRQEIEELRRDLNRYRDRPTWPVAAFISILSSLVVGLGVAFWAH